MKELVVYKKRTNVVPISFGFDISGDEITSEIRVAEDPESELIAAWVFAFVTDGVDGEGTLTLDDSASDVDALDGFMDIKRVHNGEPIQDFDEAIQVKFKKVVTV